MWTSKALSKPKKFVNQYLEQFRAILKEVFAVLFFCVTYGRLGQENAVASGALLIGLTLTMFNLPWINPWLTIFFYFTIPDNDNTPDELKGLIKNRVLLGLFTLLVVIFQCGTGCLAGWVLTEIDKNGSESFLNGMRYQFNGTRPDHDVILDEAFAVWILITGISSIYDYTGPGFNLYVGVGFLLMSISQAFPSAYLGLQSIFAVWARLAINDGTREVKLLTETFQKELGLRILGGFIGVIMAFLWRYFDIFKKNESNPDNSNSNASSNETVHRVAASSMLQIPLLRRKL